ncbi:carbon-nitrogen hydrolase family protein [Prosthecodimorpha staleyi]|uniref:Carbon-nitrogen hydrolase family protein n=1 Tax=Prosthecodimorpha staleyi TaxID=2840188 RepID=A0A947GFY1_9HYPH|nr:carbon-nitrogen hydrolase family protein [Prosthecodimorpha staleyi]MBT9291185.1 carbon-nitrogen hydrolase family protein [Prosthecodimorpha staleyi]
MTQFRAALVQTTASRSVEANIAAVEALVREAAAAGAQYVQTPENTNIMEHNGDRLFAALTEEAADPTLARLRAVAAELGIWLHVGSLAIKVAEAKAANRAFVIAPDGSVAARYDKIHLFDVDLVGGESYRESNRIRPGAESVTVDLPWGRLGLAICYDLRFPQLFRALAREAGADILSVPAAFTQQTGEAHWHVLLRARAIENGAWVFAAAQSGLHENGRSTYGHSLIVDPWGRIVAEAADGPGIAIADIDLGLVAEARGRIPALRHDRPFAAAPALPVELKAAP